MNCTKCNTLGVLNTVAGKDFYFCRTCRDEIQLEVVERTMAGFYDWLPAKPAEITPGLVNLSALRLGFLKVIYEKK